MLRSGIVQLLALLFFGMAGAASPAIAQDDVQAQACFLPQVREIMQARRVASLVACQYGDIRALLPDFTTIKWVTDGQRPPGFVLDQSARVGMPFSRLQDRFVLSVSAGPAVSIRTPTVIEGGRLTFRLARPPRVSRVYIPDYAIALDRSGRRRARAGTDYVSAVDRGFLKGGTLEVNTIPGKGIRALYVVVRLVYRPGGREPVATLGAGAGRIVPYPGLSIDPASAPEGRKLNFVAHIDRSGVPDVALAYDFRLAGEARPGVDYVAPAVSAIRFGPGQNAATLSILTMENPDSFEDRLLTLVAAAPGQRPVPAQGTITNTTTAPAVPPAETEAPPVETGTPPPAPASEGTEKGEEEVSPGGVIGNWALDWLAAIGAAALGILGGFLFGAKSQRTKDGEPEAGPEPEIHPEHEPLPVPPAPPAAVIGWSTVMPALPAIKGRSLDIDGPAVTVDADLEAGEIGRLDSLPVLSEGLPDD
ncbi:hypothetical protein [Novosphingobium beihaiensis]|uniref:Oxygen tolerance protein BatD n=1 Tax=Novosphingobium beihaiensis TaxID=2930389 RepID=A0ABT0BNQ0_9SPHN|nr:hypothetical protein [Novosphingobium beihaiensis]MCJ2186483.1 hypothetical protein [Novosphingobium beihaiensis]